MKFLRLILFVISVFPVAQSGDTPFCYDESTCGPETWPGPCSNGTHQSPINLLNSDVKEPSKKVDIKFNSEYTHPHKEYFTQNNGHTIQVSLDAKLSSKAKMTGYEMDGREYIFAQMHFHWGKEDSLGSEHMFNNKSYAMEAHLVHYSNAYPSFQAAAGSSGDPKALAVVGVFFDARSSKDFAHKGLQGIIKTMSQKYQKAPVKVKGHLTLSDFLPDIGKGHPFFRYQGSLTTPPCTEEVLWTVFKDPLTIASSQVEAFRKVKDHDKGAPVKNNVRPVKPLNDRILADLAEAKKK